MHATRPHRRERLQTLPYYGWFYGSSGRCDNWHKHGATHRKRKFALEVLDAVGRVLKESSHRMPKPGIWNCRGLTARHSELTLHLQRYPSPVLALVEAGLPGKRTLPGCVTCRAEFVAARVSLGKRTFHVLVGYVRRTVTEWPTDDLLTWCKNIDGDLLLCGDLNAHSEAWGSRKTDKRGDAVTKMLEELNLVVANDGGPTFFRPPSTYSAIDVTAHTPTLELAWATAPDTRGSDHFPIQITVKGCQMVRKVVRSCTNWDVFRAALDTSRADIATAIVQALQEATHTTRISEWLPNPDLTFLNLQAARTRAQRKYRRTKNPEDKTRFNRVSAKLRRHAKALVRARWKLMCRNVNAHSSLPKLWTVLERIILAAQTALVTSRILYRLPYLSPSPKDLERLEQLHRQGLRTALGIPKAAKNTLVLQEAGLESLERQSWERSLFQLARLSTTHPGRWFLRRIRDRRTASWSKVVEVFLQVAAPLTMPQSESRAPPWEVPKIASEVEIKYLRSKQDKPPLVIKELVEAHLKDRHSGKLQLYTDGSVNHSQTSSTAAYHIPKLSLEWSGRLHTPTSSTTAELVAMEKALLAAARLPPQPMVLLTDSRCAIQKVANAETVDPATTAVRKALAILEARGFSVCFQWIPGHVGIQGNERADGLAAEAHQLPPTVPTPAHPQQQLALDVRWHLLQEKPEKSLPKGTLTGLSRAAETLVRRLRTDTAYTNEFLAKMGKTAEFKLSPMQGRRDDPPHPLRLPGIRDPTASAA
ncbi:hypothetical protein HPB47_024024 [Ixodes persulcatus]|uniref:Uncharacterized protein n=1 Tax=Ixodes persulcatus TaxID=34615 RepID=A0AC60Q6K6_IXOPE|nr:hypothetical protein HPB47_024024 [Ixodes persulcatus]